MSALNGISKHTKFVTLKTSLQTKQAWKKTEGYGTSQDLERRKKKENLSWLNFFESTNQRWSPRGHILKSLALASKVKSLALRSQVLENWPVLGSRTAVFFELLKFCETLEKFFGKRFFVEIAWKIFVKTFFFGEHLRLCPWPRAFLSLASRVSVLGKAVLGLGLGFFFVSLALASSLVSSTPPLRLTLSSYVTCDQYAGCLQCRSVAALDFHCYSTMYICGIAYLRSSKKSVQFLTLIEVN